MFDSGIFGLEFEKKYCHIWNQHPRICLNAKFREKTKMPKFGSKSALFGYFYARILENYCHVWNQHLRICLIPDFCEETKMLKFGSNPLFEYFWPKMHPQICLFAKFHEKTKIPKFWTKNAWFGYFGAGIWKQYCHIWNQHPRLFLIAKFREKAKMPKFGIKNALFGYFWAIILKTYCHIWNQHLQICQKWVFNSNSEFWYRSTFSKGPRSAFFWKSGAGAGSAL